MPKKLLVLTFAIMFNACVTIPDTVSCSVAGQLVNGGICAHSLSAETYSQTFEQYVAWLEASETKGPAICRSLEDDKKLKTALESACRQLGSKCNYRVPKPK